MKIVVLTSNAIRHKFVANTLAQNADDTLVVVECKKNDSITDRSQSETSSPIDEHFNFRCQTEAKMFVLKYEHLKDLFKKFPEWLQPLLTSFVSGIKSLNFKTAELERKISELKDQIRS